VIRMIQALLIAAAIAPTTFAYAAMLGLGLHRHAPATAISFAATVLVFGPALMATAASAREQRVAMFGGVQLVWATLLLLGMPLYFPGERQQAVATGIALAGPGESWEELARGVANTLPAEPEVSDPEIPAAVAIVQAEALPPIPLEEHEIALPYEGEGRRLSVPVAFEHGGTTIETQMMLDTGATYTTLPTAVLETMGIFPGPTDPMVKLHTANGVREAHIVMVDQVWLGDLSIHGIAIAVCEECASGENRGLLGLNVTGGYNMLINADHGEVVFSARADRDRHLDISPFLDISASFTRFPGGRVEVVVRFDNSSARDIDRVDASVSCGDQTWVIGGGPIPAGRLETVRSRLPSHEACDGYRIAMDKAFW